MIVHIKHEYKGKPDRFDFNCDIGIGARWSGLIISEPA